MATIFDCKPIPHDITIYFKPLEVLGSGSYGSVFKCKTLELARTDIGAELPDLIALKAIKHKSLIQKAQAKQKQELSQWQQKADGEHDAEIYVDPGLWKKTQVDTVDRVVNMLHNELYMLKHLHAKLKHTIKYYGCLQTEEKLYLITEYINGKSLTSPYSFDAGQKLTLIKGVVAAIAEYHAAGLAHRDIKPDNILYTESLDIKLIDYSFTCSINSLSSAACNEGIISRGYNDPQLVPGNFNSLQLADWWACGQVISYLYLYDRLYNYDRRLYRRLGTQVKKNSHGHERFTS